MQLMITNILTTTNHNRDIFSSKYIYPVISRRAGGLSLGINLNTNNACNWQCIYCEVPNLVRGKPESIDLNLLNNELDYWLEEIVNGSFLNQYTNQRTEFKDIAFSGNGEPTATKEFESVVKLVISKVNKFNLAKKIKIRLITNGSYLHTQRVQHGLALLNELDREIWFKIDQVDETQVLIINQINISKETLKNNLENALRASPTVIQTCLFKINQKLPEEKSLQTYIKFLKPYELKVKAIHLYSLARPSEQSSNLILERLSLSEIEAIADKIKILNIPIYCYV